MASPAYPLYSDASAPDPRYCELCERYEACHCPRIAGWCAQCCPLVGQSAAAEVGSR